MKSARSLGKTCAISYEINSDSLIRRPPTSRHLFSAVVWLLPVGLPLLLSIPMTVLTSKGGVGTAMRTHHYLLIPEETKSPAVLHGGLPASWPSRQ